MRKIHILKMGASHPHIIARHGDFVDWFINGLQLPAEKVVVVDVCHSAALPDYDDCLGVIITGAHAMVTERLPWSEQTAAWLPGAVQQRIPILGVCYGHQLLAQALGGVVAYNPRGPEYGSTAIRLTAAGQADVLLGGLGSPFLAQVAHFQSVIQLPPGAQLLAASSMDPHQAFCVQGCAWGVQFHPEISAAVVQEYIQYNREALSQAGLNADALHISVQDTPQAAQLLPRFAQFCMQCSSDSCS